MSNLHALLTKRERQDGCILVKFFFAFLSVDRDELEVNKNVIKTRPISSHLNPRSLVIKECIMCPKRELFLAEPTREFIMCPKRDLFLSEPTRGSPKRARLVHHTRSGGQSEHRIRFTLPACEYLANNS